MSQFVCEPWAKNPIGSRNDLVECRSIAAWWLRLGLVSLLRLDFDVQFLCSQPEAYAAYLLRKSLNTNKVAICEV